MEGKRETRCGGLAGSCKLDTPRDIVRFHRANLFFSVFTVGEFTRRKTVTPCDCFVSNGKPFLERGKCIINRVSVHAPETLQYILT